MADEVIQTTIDSTVEGSIITYLHASGHKVIKAASCNALIDAFRLEKVKTGWLPPNTINYMKDGDLEAVCFQVPPVLMPVRWMLPTHNNGEAITRPVLTPVPRLVYFVSLKDGKNPNWKAYATQTPVKGDNTKIYMPPFSNTHNDGGICWGDMKSPKVESLADAMNVHVDFIASIFNDHLWRPYSKELLTMEREKTLPESFWRPSTYKNIGEAWNAFCGK